MRAIAVLIACAGVLGAAGGVSAQVLTPTPPPTFTPTPPGAVSPSAPGTLTPTPPPPLTPTPAPTVGPTPAPPPATANTTVTQLSSFAVGNWSGGAYSVAGSTAFDHCAESASYQNGVTLGFVVSNTFQWSMRLYDPAWNVTVGTSYPVSFAIDSSPPNVITATAINTNDVEIQLAPTAALFQRFMEGEQLKVVTASQTFIFNLTSTSVMLPDLLRCAESYAGTAPSTSNPFAKN
jgi:hypothetical protein